MKRLTAFAHKDQLDELIKKLIRLRCVEISSYENSAGETAGELDRLNCDARRLELEASLADISAAINILDPLVKRSKGLFAQKTEVDPESFVAKGHAQRAVKTVAEALAAEQRLNAIKGERAKYEAAVISATPYVGYDMPLGSEGTECAESFLGVLPAATDLDVCGKELYKNGAIAELLLRDKNGIYAVFYCHRSDSAQVNSVLSSYGFLRANFSGVDMTADEYIKDAQIKIEALGKEEERIRERMISLAERVDALEVLYDMEASELVSVEQKLKLAGTDSTVMIKGWIPAGRQETVSAFLDGFDCAYELSDPEGEEIPPILLKNNGFASNFEWVLGMYSYPAYGRFDPTFIMSIFYFIIFG